VIEILLYQLPLRKQFTSRIVLSGRVNGVRHQLKPKKSLKAEQAGAFFSSESGEKKRTGRGGLSVTSIGKRIVNSRNANPNGRVGLRKKN
jgi:hypothetical protein